MELTLDEKLTLILYLEIYGRCYNPGDWRKREIITQGIPMPHKVLLRRQEMKCLYLLFQSAGIALGGQTTGYHFIYGWREIHCDELDEELKTLDGKLRKIEVFYQTYLKERNQENLNEETRFERLKNNLFPWFFTTDEVHTIAKICYGLKTIGDREAAVEIAAVIVERHDFVRANPEASAILEDLPYCCGFLPSDYLLKKIYTVLKATGLINKVPEEVLEQEQVKKFVPSDNK